MSDEVLADRGRLVALLEEYGSDAAVAAEAGVDRSTVTRWRERHGIEARSATGRAAPASVRAVLRDPERLASLIGECGTLSGAAAQLDVSPGTVRYWVATHELDVDVPDPKAGRPLVGGDRLASKSAVEGVLSEHGTVAAAARACGVSPSTVKRRMQKFGITRS